MEELQAIAATDQAAVSLVLPAGLCADEAADLARAYARAGARHLIATRLDFARRLGSVLAAAHAGRLSLAEAGMGPGAADGLVPLTSDFLPGGFLPTRCSMNRGRLIAVASGKGGVGKTWLCISLAHALAKAGRRVLLFDADFGLANIDVQLGLMPKHDLSTILACKVGLRDAVTHVEGFDIVPGRSGSGMLTGLSPAIVDRVLGIARTASLTTTSRLWTLGPARTADPTHGGGSG